MDIKNLKANPDNPRTITPERLEVLKKALQEFGDLSGVVFNKQTGRLVSGHQRVKIFGAKAKVSIEKTYRKPSPTGTVAEGFIDLGGERFRYREVAWDATKEKAAAIAANRTAGDWDTLKLADWFKDIGDFGFDLDLSMFDSIEVGKVLTRAEKAKTKSVDVDGEDEEEDKPTAKKEKKRVVCPECNHKFVPGWQ